MHQEGGRLITLAVLWLVVCQSVHRWHHQQCTFLPLATFIKLVIVEKLRIESLARTKVILALSQLTSESIIANCQIHPLDSDFDFFGDGLVWHCVMLPALILCSISMQTKQRLSEVECFFTKFYGVVVSS